MPRVRYSGTNIDAFYSSPQAPGSFLSVRNLQRYSGRTVSEVRKFLAGRDAYTMHKPQRIRFPRRRGYKRARPLLSPSFVIRARWGKYFTAATHDMSCECTKSELNLFSVSPTQTSMEHGSWVEYHPLTTVTDGSPIEFDVIGSGDDYVDFANTMLHVKDKVTHGNDTDLAAGFVVGPVNLFLHSLFLLVDISLNGSTLITFSTNTYPYRAMI